MTVARPDLCEGEAAVILKDPPVTPTGGTGNDRGTGEVRTILGSLLESTIDSRDKVGSGYHQDDFSAIPHARIKAKLALLGRPVTRFFAYYCQFGLRVDLFL